MSQALNKDAPLLSRNMLAVIVAQFFRHLATTRCCSPRWRC